MSKFNFICLVLFYSICSANALKYNRNELKKKYPKIGVDFIYLEDLKGQLKRIDMKHNDHTNKKLKAFIKREKDVLKKCTSLHSSAYAKHASTHISIAHAIKKPVTEKFYFHRDDITFTLYNRKYPNGIALKNYNFAEYDSKKGTKVVTHGFLSSGKSGSCMDITKNYLSTSDFNVIVVDWSKISDNPVYPIVVSDLGSVADYCAEFLNYLFKSVGVNSADIQLIGHSLGAQLWGFTARRTKMSGNTIAMITGLDPAGPLFDSIHLNTKDGDFVIVIHTDSNWFGIKDSIGHVDFRPNGGDAPQPGCSSMLILGVESCSHSKSWKLYADSIKNKNVYLATCPGNKKVLMGSATPSTARGDCYINTN